MLSFRDQQPLAQQRLEHGLAQRIEPVSARVRDEVVMNEIRIMHDHEVAPEPPTREHQLIEKRLGVDLYRVRGHGAEEAPILAQREPAHVDVAACGHWWNQRFGHGVLLLCSHIDRMTKRRPQMGDKALKPSPRR